MDDSSPTNPLHRLLVVDQATNSKHYYIDVHDGKTLRQDNRGIDLLDENKIASEVYNILKQIVYDQWPEGQRTMTARVRDGSGKFVYEATMTINGRRYPS